ncbi:hypothetical protein E7Z59_07005 [Robertkochia marina]|uniref:Nuclear transport factor 2 family protein n=1 Tax=Robertkochia marina TaxID=1227945 RepID=A0A4S3M0C0_9FLAO|nr:hypothetical protein [Robertkochia marina]THD67403.1 hypothetical protein E7Z59_07005 [Robertkochia marina]TRZ43057.1 hypothetical protein D3A96_11310 [Robertkochia marina]
MNKIITLILISIFLASCNLDEKKIDQLSIATEYYSALDKSNYSEIDLWFSDSLAIKEEAYEQVYSQEEYIEFLKWDSTFNPSYEILEIEKIEKGIKAKISKSDKRIQFLHKEPFITNQTIKFDKNKITSVEIEYVNFNDSIWEINKNQLLNWIDQNHPELNGFIYDQTKNGGKKFLRAMELYKNKN